MSLLYANKTENDILQKDELVGQKGDRLQVSFTLDSPSAEWPLQQPGHHKGFISQEMLSHMHPAGPTTLNLLCGPFPMVKMTAQHLSALGHTQSSIFRF